MDRNIRLLLMGLASLPLMMSCKDDSTVENDKLIPAEDPFGKANSEFSAEEWYPGGELGTTRNASYSAPTVPVENMGLDASFKKGEDNFEHLYTFTEEPRKGLGPAWVRNSCIHCHPSYGHGKRMTRYRANDFGNGYLLVIYHPEAGVDLDGVAYAKNSYIRQVTGMPQTKAMAPFKAPIDGEQIKVEWLDVKEMESGLPMEFPDGEKYSLIYPEVTIPQSAFNTNPLPVNYEVRLENTIGVYGTGLLDAIDQDDMKAQYQKEAPYVELNPAMWDKSSNDWAASAWYTLADGQKKIKKFTYAMTRASLQDGPGANAIWNITNVTRSDRHYFYSTPAWAKAMSEDEDVISYIQANGNDKNSLLYPYYADGTKEGISARVNELLSISSNAGAETFKKYFVEGSPYNGNEEMTDRDYYDFMVWHRGLAVPAARNLDDAAVQRGKKVFTEIGCTACHRPSWKTRDDNLWIDNSIKAYAASIGKDASSIMPKYPNQTIWPYTDMVQHRLFMKNDIRTGWCRTTPLWGRGLSLRLTGAEDRLHDARARNEIEAIMWHAYSKESDAWESTLKFYNLPKSDRDAVVKFLQAI